MWKERGEVGTPLKQRDEGFRFSRNSLSAKLPFVGAEGWRVMHLINLLVDISDPRTGNCWMCAPERCLQHNPHYSLIRDVEMIHVLSLLLFSEHYIKLI